MTSTERIKGPFSMNEGMEEFLGVIRKIIPETIDNNYGLLVDLLDRYKYLVTRLNQLSKSNDRMSYDASEVNIELAEIDRQINLKQQELLKVVEKLCKTSISSEERGTIVSDQLAIAMEMDELTEKRTRTASKQKDQTTTMDEKSVEMAEIQDEIRSVVEEMNQTLKQVDQLNMGDMDRLDNLAVRDKHVEKVEKIVSKVYGNRLNENEKKKIIANVYLFMLSYLSAKRNEFKTAKEVATRAVGAYEERSLLDPNDSSLQMVTSVSNFDSHPVGFILGKVFCPVDHDINGDRTIDSFNGISEGLQTMSTLMKSKLEGVYDVETIQTALKSMNKTQERVFDNGIDGGNIYAFSSVIATLCRLKEQDSKQSQMKM